MDKRIKLKDAAKILGICYRHAQRLSYEGKIPNIVTDTGRRYVPESWLLKQLEITPIEPKKIVKS
jgi:predicted site-specific integrase-resolvase